MYYLYSSTNGPNNNNSMLASLEVALVQGSVKLYKAVPDEKGELQKKEEVKDWKWTCTSKEHPYDPNDQKVDSIITATGVPDSTPLILEYVYLINSTIEKGFEVNLPVSNTAKLEGIDKSASGTIEDKTWKDQESSGGATTGNKYLFYKVEKGNYNNTISGAEFTVYQCDKDGKPTETRVQQYTTDETTGTFRIEWDKSKYDYNTLYMVKETKAPDHYKLSDDIKEYYFYFSNEKDTEHALPSSLPESAVDLSKSSQTVYVENIRDVTDIVVKKVWKDKDGKVTSHNGSGIELELYRKESYKPGDEKGVPYCVVNYYHIPDVLVPSVISGDAEIGSTIEFTVKALECSQYSQPPIGIHKGAELISGSWNFDTQYYTGTAKVTGKEICFKVAGDKFKLDTFSVKYISIPASETGEKIKEFTLSTNNDWREEFVDLPLHEVRDGKTFIYTYYVNEVNIDNYDVTYENNNGITNGIITVTNQAKETPDYELPKTGGPGMLPYIGGGLLLICTGFCQWCRRKKYIKGHKASV